MPDQNEVVDQSAPVADSAPVAEVAPVVLQEAATADSADGTVAAGVADAAIKAAPAEPAAEPAEPAVQEEIKSGHLFLDKLLEVVKNGEEELEAKVTDLVTRIRALF